MNPPLNLFCYSCIGLFFLIIILLALFFAFKKKQSWEQEWGKLARLTGLTYEGKTLDQLSEEANTSEKIFRFGPPQIPPKLQGTWRGYPVSIDHKKIHFNEQNYWFTRYQVSVPVPPDRKLSIKQRLSVGPFGRFKAPDCTKEMRSDFKLPPNMKIRGQPDSFVRALLQKPYVRNNLPEIGSGYELRVEDQLLKLGVNKLKIPADQMESHLRMAVDLASLLETV